MIEDAFIIDAAVHGLQSTPEIANENRYIKSIVDLSFWVQSWVPDEYAWDWDRFYRSHPSEELLSALFYESQTDMACYHALPMKGLAKDYCPISIGLEMRERYPHRMMIYAPLHPLDGVEATIEELERNVEEVGVDGLKLYPMDLIDGKIRTWSMADEQLLYPIYERCLELGVKVIAVHKAVPLGIAAMDPFRVGDVDYAARDFPDLKFEIVHAGLAFLDESAWQVSRYENVYVNMDTTAQFVLAQPDKFARVIGEFLLSNGEDKLLWSTGCNLTHARPVIEAFWNFEMPRYLVESGYPELTREIKAKILGLNYARLHDLDVYELKQRIAADDIEAEKAQGLRQPWTLV
jgi:predicted TIM-barrel fold metal-dependent hydrolase